ncbi:hypothetical protein [Spirillospora sp. CA-128828]|uniref:hypothetical protein n=1 Tax=Spirillospora sp. CA-128828 TaxID=3240033 RepID=UPI003D93BB46
MAPAPPVRPDRAPIPLGTGDLDGDRLERPPPPLLLFPLPFGRVVLVLIGDARCLAVQCGHFVGVLVDVPGVDDVVL